MTEYRGYQINEHYLGGYYLFASNKNKFVFFNSVNNCIEFIDNYIGLTVGMSIN